jgi:antitoxin YefM
MEVISYSAVRAKLAEAMDKVNDDHRPVIITRQRGKQLY